jgi:hypothetical protein
MASRKIAANFRFKFLLHDQGPWAEYKKIVIVYVCEYAVTKTLALLWGKREETTQLVIRRFCNR